MVMVILVLLGWIAGIPNLTTFGIGGLAAQPVTASVLGLVASAQLVHLLGHIRYRLPLLGLALALVILSQIDLAAGAGLSFNRLLVELLPAAAKAHMRLEALHPTTMIELLLLIFALLPATATKRRRASAALALATIALLIGGVVVIGYMNGVDIARIHPAVFVMPFPSAAMSLSLAASIILWRYCDGWPAVFWTTPEDFASRWLLPLLLALVLIEYGFRLLVDRGFIEDGIADALTLVADMTIIVAIVVPGSHRLAERRRERDDLAGAIELAAVMVLDQDGIILHWSRGCTDLYGWSSDLAVGRRRRELLRSVGEPARDAWASIGADSTYYAEIVEHHRDGRRLITANHAKRPTRAKDRKSSVVAVTDITDRRAAEAALQSSEARLRAAVDVQGLAIFEWDLVNRKLDWTINPEALCGETPILSDNDFASWGEHAIAARDWTDLSQVWRETVATKGSQFRRTVYVQQKPGVFCFFEMSTSLMYADGVPTRSILICNDVTEHYRREEAIMLGEARLATAVAAQGIFIYEYDLIAERPIWTTSGENFFGSSANDGISDIPGSDWAKAPEVGLQIRGAVLEAIESGRERVHFSFEFERLDGQKRYADSWARIVRDEDGQAIRVIGTHLDITERHEREAALRASEAEMRAILATVPDAMIVCNETGVIRAHSATAETLFGFAGPDLIGRNILDFAADDRAGQAALRRRLRHMKVRARSGEWPMPIMARRANGEPIPVSFVLGDAVVGGQLMFVAFGRDMRPHIASEERFHTLQNQLRLTTRLATMGEMAAALAHELSQPLAAVVNFLGAAALTLETDRDHDRLDRAVHSASEQALRAGEIIRRLRALISRGEADLRVESITRLIREAAALALLNITSLGVQLSYDFEDEDRMVMGDAVQIQQVLVNLIRNGVDAITSSGGLNRELIISTSAREDDFLQIDVRDTGPGIDPDIVDTLFSPFKTTKSDGLGFGLAICRRIVEAHGGQISAETSPSGGAIFRFTLPVADKEAQRP